MIYRYDSIMMRAQCKNKLLQRLMPDQNPNRNKEMLEAANEIFLAYDAFLTFNCTAVSLLSIGNRCMCLSFLIYAFLYLIQTVQHYLIYIFPKIDINKHHIAYRRVVIFMCMTVTGYMLFSVTFWQKSQLHPVYCLLCIQNNVGLWVGLLIVFHCIFLIGWGIALIHSYVTRRYYLLALGGFQVEQRILQQRARQLNEVLIIEPDTHQYPIRITKEIYYKFEDVIQVDEQSYECTICLDKQVKDDHFVDAGCGHFYHQICLIQWAQFNSNCPQCRKKFEQEKIYQDEQEYQDQVIDPPQQILNQQKIDGQVIQFEQKEQKKIENQKLLNEIKKVQIQIEMVTIQKQKSSNPLEVNTKIEEPLQKH